MDTTTTPHSNVGKFLSSLLSPLTVNNHNLRSSFHAVSEIKTIPHGLFDQDYCFVSFDTASLFTNVPLKRTIEILKHVFEDKLINTTLTKRTLKKLLLDYTTRTAFLFDNIFYEQTDGVSMGSSLAPVLTNIIITEFEKAIVDDLIKTGIIAFYRCYVDNTLVLIKPKDNPFNLNKNLKFMVDNFENGKIHFLDIEISGSGVDIFRKSTHTGQCTHLIVLSLGHVKQHGY